MLELKDISFNVQDDSKEKEIIRHLDLNIDEVHHGKAHCRH